MRKKNLLSDIIFSKYILVKYINGNMCKLLNNHNLAIEIMEQKQELLGA